MDCFKFWVLTVDSALTNLLMGNLSSPTDDWQFTDGESEFTHGWLTILMGNLSSPTDDFDSGFCPDKWIGVWFQVQFDWRHGHTIAMPLLFKYTVWVPLLNFSFGTLNDLDEAKGPIRTRKVYTTKSQTEFGKRFWFTDFAPWTVPSQLVPLLTTGRLTRVPFTNSARR